MTDNVMIMFVGTECLKDKEGEGAELVTGREMSLCTFLKYACTSV